MRKKLKNLKNFLFFGAALLLALSCSKDVYEDGMETESSERLLIRKINFDEFKNASAYSKYASYEEAKRHKMSSRMIEDTIYNYTIDTNQGKYIESGDYNSYTFPAYKSGTDENSKVENVLFSINKDGGYDIYIVKYDFTAQDLESLTEDEINLEAAAYTLLGEDGKLAEQWCHDTYREECGIPDHEGDLVGGDVGTHCEWILHSSDCVSVGGGGGGGGISFGNGGLAPSDNPHGSGGSGGGQAGTPAPVIITTPAIDQLAIAKNNFIRSLAAEQRSWLNNFSNPSKPLIYGYLDANFYSPDSSAFVKEAIQALMNGSEVDFEDEIILDSTFVNSKTECVHEKLKSVNNFYSDMLSVFNSSTSHNLTFKIGNVPAGDWGITDGNPNVLNDYVITMSPSIENKPNLIKITILGHELIHAFMFDILENNGLMHFDNNRDPILDIACAGNSNNSNLNQLSTPERLTALLCAMNENGTLTNLWSHDLFNSNIFSINSYRMQLENLILNSYDWNSETNTFKREAIAIFGNNWKQEIAKACSWLGLHETDGYIDYINSYNNNIPKLLYLNNLSSKLQFANNNCP